MVQILNPVKKQHRKNVKNATSEFFSKHGDTKDGLDNRCKKCVRNVGRKLRKNHKDTNVSDIDFFQNITEYLDWHEPDKNNIDWQGGKITGTIFQRKNAIKYSCNYKYVDELGKHNATRQVSTLEEGRKFLWSAYKKFGGKITNQYKFVKYNNEWFVIVQLTKKYVTILNEEHLDFVRKVNLCVSKSGHDNSVYYCAVSHGVAMMGIHNIITGFDMCDHINRYPLDNRTDNIVLTTFSLNNQCTV